MAKTLLRSGNRDDFQAVGGGGQAVFDAAQQIRETLRLRRQQALADCLAIPQVNEDGDRIDWYSPIAGSVLSWKAADDALQQRTLRQLDNLYNRALALSENSLKSEKTAQRRFGALLGNALQFPGENHLFIVDGKPVLTFWGFVNLNESAREAPFACLQGATPPVVFKEAESPLQTVTPEPEPEPQAIAPVAESPDAPVAQPVSPSPRRWLRWSLPAAALLTAVIAVPLLWMRPTTSAAPVAKAEASPVAPLPQLADSLPLSRASIVIAREEQKTAPAPVAIAAVAKDALVMDENQVRAGVTRFLNGHWRVLITARDPITGKPPSLRYQIQNNKGTARVVYGDNIICRATIFSGLHQNGELLIKSHGSARCSDGSRYPMPEISCKAGASDVAECTGRYNASTVAPLTFKKVGG